MVKPALPQPITGEYGSVYVVVKELRTYSDQVACMQLENETSEYTKIERGVR